MERKVLLILVDGMRPDSLKGIGEAEDLMAKSACALDAQTIIPPVTLPCHMSLFHSVPAERHGILSNRFTPMSRPIDGIFETVSQARILSAMYYNYHPLRYLARAETVVYEYFDCLDLDGPEISNGRVTAKAIEGINEHRLGFIFTYLGSPDSAGHNYGWMTDEYLQSVRSSWKCIAQLLEAAGDDYTVIVTADHGGHDRDHGVDIPDDMNIPIIIKGPDFEPGSRIEGANIMDIAPTVTDLLQIPHPKEWEGKSLLGRDIK